MKQTFNAARESEPTRVKQEPTHTHTHNKTQSTLFICTTLPGTAVSQSKIFTHTQR